MTIAAHAAYAADALRSEAPRARCRCLDAEDIEHAIRAHLKAARAATRRDEGEWVVTVDRGGVVTNGYRGRAECDAVRITGTRVSDLEVTTTRGPAPRRPYGRGATLVVRCLRPGQPFGRVVHSE